MITYLKADRGGLINLSQPEVGCWINVVAPTADEIADLRVMGIPADYLSYPLDPDERARSEREDGNLLIILRIPHFQGEGADIPFITVPLGIILTPDYLVTVIGSDNDLIEELGSGRSAASRRASGSASCSRCSCTPPAGTCRSCGA